MLQNTCCFISFHSEGLQKSNEVASLWRFQHHLSEISPRSPGAAGRQAMAAERWSKNNVTRQSSHLSELTGVDGISQIACDDSAMWFVATAVQPPPPPPLLILLQFRCRLGRLRHSLDTPLYSPTLLRAVLIFASVRSLFCCHNNSSSSSSRRSTSPSFARRRVQRRILYDFLYLTACLFGARTSAIQPRDTFAATLLLLCRPSIVTYLTYRICWSASDITYQFHLKHRCKNHSNNN